MDRQTFNEGVQPDEEPINEANMDDSSTNSQPCESKADNQPHDDQALTHKENDQDTKSEQDIDPHPIPPQGEQLEHDLHLDSGQQLSDALPDFQDLLRAIKIEAEDLRTEVAQLRKSESDLKIHCESLKLQNQILSEQVHAGNLNLGEINSLLEQQRIHLENKIQEFASLNTKFDQYKAQSCLQVQELEQQIGNLNQELEAQERLLAETKTTNEDRMTQEIALAIQKCSEQNEEQKQQLIERLKQMESSFQTLQERETQFANDLSALKETEDKLTQQLQARDALVAQLNARNAEFADLSQQQDQLRLEFENQLSELRKRLELQETEAAQQLESRLSEIANLTERLSQSRAEVDDRQNRIKELEVELVQQEDAYGAQFDVLEKQVKKQQETIAELQTKLDEAEKAKEREKLKPDMVMLPKQTLLQWEKRSTDQLGQIKSLQAENAQLKSQLEEIPKLQNALRQLREDEIPRLQNAVRQAQLESSQVKNQYEQQAKLQNSQQMKSNLSLEGMNQRCAALQQIIDQSSIQIQKQESELTLLKQLHAQLKDDHQEKERELKDLRKTTLDKFRIEQELQQAQMVIAEHRDQSKQMAEVQQNFAKCQEDLEMSQRLLKQSEQLKVKIQSKYDEIYEELQRVKQQLLESERERDQKVGKAKDLEKLLSQQFEEFAALEQKYKDQCGLNEDMRNQQKINLKRYQHETDQLREELMQQQKAVQKLEELNHNMHRDLQIMRDHQFKMKSQEGPLSKKEKIVVESLSARVQELELENKQIKEAMGSKVLQLQSQLEAKLAYINHLGQQLSKGYPSLEECDMLDQEDIKFVQQMKKKQNVQEILEKTLVENLQLREQIRVLGLELNKRAR